MQLIHNKDKSKPKKLSPAQQFAKILVAKWQRLDKLKAESIVKNLNLQPGANVQSTPTPSSNPLAGLEHLIDLLDRGLINLSEFKNLKSQILR